MQTVGEAVGGPFRQFGPWEEFSEMSKVFSDLKMCFASGGNARLHRRSWGDPHTDVTLRVEDCEAEYRKVKQELKFQVKSALEMYSTTSTPFKMP